MRASIETELPRNLDAASRARRLLDELLASQLEATQLDRSKLLVSELVNDAVLHGQGKITLRVDLDEDRLRAEVIDEGSVFEHVVRDNAFDRLGEWGSCWSRPNPAAGGCTRAQPTCGLKSSSPGATWQGARRGRALSARYTQARLAMSDWARKLDVLIHEALGRYAHAQAGETRARRRKAGTQRIASQAESLIEKQASYGEPVAGPGAWRGMSTRDIEAYLREQGPNFWMRALSEPDGSSGRVMQRRQRRAAAETGDLSQQAEDELGRVRDAKRQLLARRLS